MGEAGERRARGASGAFSLIVIGLMTGVRGAGDSGACAVCSVLWNPLGPKLLTVFTQTPSSAANDIRFPVNSYAPSSLAERNNFFHCLWSEGWQ